MKWRSRRPRWSLRSTFFYCCGLAAVVVPLVLLVGKKSIWSELELAVGFLSLILFFLLWHVLYHGVRFDKNGRFRFVWRSAWSGAEGDVVWMDWMDTGGAFTKLGAGEGLVGALLGFLLDVIVSVLASFFVVALVWLGFNVLTVSITALLLPFYLLFRRFIGFVAWRGRLCRGQLGKSLRYAAYYTIGGAVWVYAVLFLARFIARIVR